MKYVASILAFMVPCFLGGTAVYRSDGSSIPLTPVPELTAFLEVAAGASAGGSPIIEQWRAGSKIYTIRQEIGGFPVYRYGQGYFIARPEIFWRGSENPRKLAHDFGLTLVEILPAYRLYKFTTTDDSVIVAQKIVEQRRGFAFPNLVREVRLRLTLPQDEFYADYQWERHNRGAYNDVYGNPIETLPRADIRFEDALRFLIKVHYDPVKYATKVAIMDSGVVTTHPDLVGDGGKMNQGYDAIRDEEGADPHIPENASGYELAAYAHGTDCAGIAAAEMNAIGVAGVCPWCGIYPVLALEGTEGSVITEEMYLKTYDRFVADPSIVAVNCSFGPTSEYGELPMMPGVEESHIHFMKNGRNGKGGAIIYASGNEGINVNYDQMMTHIFSFERDGVPVSHRLIVVGATSAWDTHIGYSNWGAELTISAPSLSSYPVIGIATTHIPGAGRLKGDWTASFSGTSAAAPFITGALGFIFSLNPDLTLEEAVNILYQSADKIHPETGFWDENGHSIKFGYGRLNLHKATRLALGYPMCDPLLTREEVPDNLDNDCDGWVDEEVTSPITVGKPCSADNECVMNGFMSGTHRCLPSFLGYPVSDGYCTVFPQGSPCPDGSLLVSSGIGLICIRECNDSFPCNREGFYCNDPVYGICLPYCKKDEDCPEGHHCDDEAKCHMDPSPTGGPCFSEKDCLYSGSYCDTSKPGGYCFTLCDDYDDKKCPDDAKCIYSSRSRTFLCAASCTSDADCRPEEETRYYKCHVSWQDKKGVCFRPCRNSGECLNTESGDDNAYCNEEGRCVPYGWTAPDTDTGTPYNDEPALSDRETDYDIIFTLPASKESNGCSLTTL